MPTLCKPRCGKSGSSHPSPLLCHAAHSFWRSLRASRPGTTGAGGAVCPGLALCGSVRTSWHRTRDIPLTRLRADWHSLPRPRPDVCARMKLRKEAPPLGVRRRSSHPTGHWSVVLVTARCSDCDWLGTGSGCERDLIDKGPGVREWPDLEATVVCRAACYKQYAHREQGDRTQMGRDGPSAVQASGALQASDSVARRPCDETPRALFSQLW